MGYESHWTGQVRIEPALTWGEIKNNPRSPGLQDLKLRLDEHTEDTLTGQVRIITAAVIEPLTSGPFNGYDVETELQALVEAHPAHEFTGAIEARPVDPDGTPWRYIVQGRKVVRQEQLTAWPGEDADQVEQARRIAVALEQENAHLTVQVERVRAWATSHEYRWLHELLDGYGTRGGHL
ncbi:DUF6205 family protein [Streptomyces sp. NPDC059340]|uniref:DUF6205 family protein n=1 Tax=Streptomyces sp. NPDC059340 TaxID=3346806 RepID=UPI0036CCF1C1